VGGCVTKKEMANKFSSFSNSELILLFGAICGAYKGPSGPIDTGSKLTLEIQEELQNELDAEMTRRDMGWAKR
jgi:hypothetical protein